MFKKWFKKNKASSEANFDEIKINELNVGDLFDYDLTTWEVTSSGQCDYDGHIESEWEVRGAIGSRTLVAIPDSADWNYQWLQEKTLNELSLQSVQDDLRSEKDPEENLYVNGLNYIGYESGGGLYKTLNEEKPFLYWSYENSENHVLNIIQWSDNEFSTTIGMRVAEFEFSNILPGSGRGS